MPSPIAHSLAGLTIAHVLAGERERGRVSWYAFALVAANAADLDFAAGLVSGSINALHGGPTHSVTAAIAFAGITAAILGLRGGLSWRLPVLGLCGYLSHIALDMSCEASPKNPGMLVLWPFTEERLLSPWRPLPGIAHGGRAGGVSEFLRELFSMQNLPAAVVEFAVFAPLLFLVVRLRSSRDLRSSPLPVGLRPVESPVEERRRGER